MVSPHTKKAFILYGKKRDPFLQEKLTSVLNSLGCGITSVDTWEKMMDLLQEQSPSYDLLAFDLSVEGFDFDEMERVLSSIESSKRPRSIICSYGIENGAWLIGEELAEEQLNCGARIDPLHTKEEIAFILNQVLYPAQLNKRKYPRALVDCEVEYFQFNDRTRKRLKAFNLSSGGVFLKTKSPEPKRTFINLEIFLSGEKNPVSCAGRVVFNHVCHSPEEDFLPSGMGVRFQEINEKNRTALEKFTADRLLRINQLNS